VLSELWLDLYRERWDWVDDAVSEFRSGLDHTLAEHFDDSDKVFDAVVYGPSQSGKTTLILRLLGTTEERLDEVAVVLRAGRTQGQSSTATPVRYHWSTDVDLWEYRRVAQSPGHAPHPSLVNAHELLQILASHRASMGSTPPGSQIVEVGIPARFRGDTGPKVLPRVLDLPGAHARTDDDSGLERGVADELIRRYVPTAHVVVLVCAAHQAATELFAGLPQSVPMLRQWSEYPERFRIVLTHAISNQSVEDRLKADAATLNSQWLRAHAFDQYFPDSSSFPEGGSTGEPGSEQRFNRRSRIEQRMYPVEYGDSWRGLAKDRPDLQRAATPVVDDLLNELVTTLGHQATEDARRIGIPRAAETVYFAARRHLMQLERHVDECRTYTESQLRHVEHQTKLATAAEARRQRIEKLNKDFAAAKRGPQWVAVPFSTPSGNRKEAIDHGAQYGKALQRAWEEQWRRWRDSPEVLQVVQVSVDTPNPPAAKRIFDDEWDCCGTCFPVKAIVRKGPRHCRDKQSDAVEPATIEIGRRSKQAVDSWVGDVAKSLRKKGLTAQEAKRLVTEAEANLASATTSCKQATSDLQRAETELTGYRKTALEAERQAEELSRSLTMLLNAFLLDYRGRFRAAGNSDERGYLGIAVGLALMNADRIGLVTAKGIDLK